MTTRWHVSYDGVDDRGMIAPVPEEGAALLPIAPVTIQFQHGPIGENGINGIQNEELIDLIIMRLRYLDDRFPCDENLIAINYLDAAVGALRTEKRRAQGVEGQNLPHVS